MKKFPNIIPVFPLSGVIYFPKTNLPLNIFEQRYLNLINDAYNKDKLMGMVQSQKDSNEVYKVGCLGKITSFKESDDGRYLIDLKGVIRFEIKKEINSNKKYREFEINFENFLDDLVGKKENLKFSDLELIFKDLKTLFEKRGFIINWKALEKQSLDETINALAMTSPFSLEEKQVLLEARNLEVRKTKISEILNTYTYDQFDNTTLQ